MNEFEIIAVANLEVTDADEYRKYEKGFFPILKKHNGSFITFDDFPVHKEGDIPLIGRVILFGFKSEEDANNWCAPRGDYRQRYATNDGFLPRHIRISD